MLNLHSPADLCERLGMRPTDVQLDLMQEFYEDIDPLQIADVPSQQTSNTVAMMALWRLLRVKGSKCIVISSKRDLESRFMSFMRDVTTLIDPELTSLCSWSNSRKMGLSNEAGYELRCVSNRPEWLAGLNYDAVTWIVLGAGSSNPNFVRTMQAIKPYRGQEGHRHIYLW